VVLNLLHGRLGVERVLDSSELVHSGEVRDRLSGVSRGSGKSERSGSVESHGCSGLSDRVRLGALERGLLSGLGLDILGLGGG
jgi:hypothetical protein